MANNSIWDKEIEVPEKTIQYIDPNVREKLPPGTQLHGISQSGKSHWARTAKIDATNAAGEETPIFIKVHRNDTGKTMASSEYYAMKALHSVMPEMAAEPLGWGRYKEMPDIWFYACRYVELTGALPDKSMFTSELAELHRRGASTKGEFGFPIVTYGGRNPHWFPVTHSWEETFSRGLDRTFEMEEQAQGPDEELAQLRGAIMTKVIPRLLRPLETEGRHVVPTLVHGDIWDGNISVDKKTGQAVIFDATPLYAHNEYEMSPWWAPRHEMNRLGFIEEYVKHFEKSEPKDDFEDRGLLYGLRFDLHASSLYKGKLMHRHIAMDTMRRLVKAYPLGYEGYLEVKRSRQL